MSNKKNNEKSLPEPINTLGELDQLRQIVFGDAQQELITQLTTLRSDMEQAIDAHDNKFSARLDKMQKDVNLQFEALNNQLHSVDKIHDEHEASIQKEHESLISEHEMFAATTQQDLKSIEQSLNNESSSLANTFNEQLEQLKNHLDEVSKELSSSKTDRKTLARLLATMATNLENDSL